MPQNTKGLKGQGHTSRSSVKVTDLFYQHCVCYCWISTRNLKMMLLLDFAVTAENRSGGKKPLGDHSNNNIDQRVTSSVNNNNNNKKELDQNQESSPLWSLINVPVRERLSWRKRPHTCELTNVSISYHNDRPMALFSLLQLRGQHLGILHWAKWVEHRKNLTWFANS